MDRRTFLAAGAAAGVLPGCATLEIAPSAEVAVRPVRFLAGAAEAEALRRDVQPDDIRSIDEVPEALQGPLRQAVDGQYATDDVSDALLAVIDDFRDPKDNYRLDAPAVRIDGTAYVIEARVPTLVVELTGTDAAPADAAAVFPRERINADDLDPAVQNLVNRLHYRGPNAPRLSYRTSAVPEAIQDFLDEYDYLEDSQGVGRIATERRNADPPYTIDVRELTLEDRWGRPVIDGATLDPDLRAFVREVLAASRELPSEPYLTDSVPDGYFEHLQPTGDFGTDPHVRLDDSIYHVHVTEGEHKRLPVDVSAAAVGSGDEGRHRFEVTVAATGEGPDPALESGESVELFGHVGLPSVLWIDDGEEHHLLRSDAYEHSVATNSTAQTSTKAALLLTVGDRDLEVLSAERRTQATEWALDLDVDAVRETTVFETLPVGSELTATYAIPETVPAGTYASPGFFGVMWGGEAGNREREGIYPFELDIGLE